MKKESSLRVLLLADAPMAVDGGGIAQTLYNLFSFIEPSDFLAVAPLEELNKQQPTQPYLDSYKSYKSRWFNSPNNRFSKYLNPFVEWVNFSLCQLRSYNALRQQISSFKPDVIVSCPNSPIGVLMHKKLLNGNLKGVPVVPYFMDDWMYQKNTVWLGGNVNEIAGEMLSDNKNWIMIGNELADIFKERYQVSPTKVHCARNPVDISNAPADDVYTKKDPFTIAYAGALWSMHYDSFYAVAKAVQQLSQKNNMRLIWYGPTGQWDWRKDELTPLGVIYGGHVAYSEVHATLNKADALLITSSFKKEYYTHSKGSIQTKITDYCKSKRLIVSCGPEYSANHNFIKSADCGICIETDNVDSVAEKLLLIFNKIEEYQFYVTNGFKSLDRFSKEVVHGDLKNFLTTTAETGTILN